MQLSVEALDDLVMLINNRSLEKDKRILLAAAAKAYGHGGEKRVKDLTGMAFSTLRRGRNDAEKELGRSTVGDHVIEIQPQPTVSDKVEQGEKNDDNFAKQCCLLILRLFYMNPYDADKDFYEQFDCRMKKMLRTLEAMTEGSDEE